MKFIHTSDWHLGRQLHHESLLDEQAYILQQISELAATHQVDAIIVAGDIYDRSVPPASAVSLLDDFLEKVITELQIPIIMIAGNHDGHQRLAFAARQMASSGLHIIGPLTTPIEPIVINDVCFYPIPFHEPATVSALLNQPIASAEQAMAALLEPITAHNSQGRSKVIIGHCFLSGGSESDSERLLSIGGADRIDPALFNEFDYVALGHLHGPQYKGAEHIRYSGSPLKYSFSEQNHKKSVTLVEINLEKIEINLLALTPKRDIRIIEGMLADVIAAGKDDPRNDDFIMVRLMDTHALLDPMGKLRQVYPNTLHLERTGLIAQQPQDNIGRDRIDKGVEAMFHDFFSQTTGNPMTEPQQALIKSIVEAIHKEEK